MRFYRQFIDRGSWPRAMQLGYQAACTALERWAGAGPRAVPSEPPRAESSLRGA